jgi:hypothetical protein
MQSAAVVGQGCDDGDLFLLEVQGDGVLLEDGIVAPAPRAVELRHERRLVLETHPVDAVLVAVERQQVAIGAVAEVLDRGQDEIRLQLLEGDVEILG